MTSITRLIKQLDVLSQDIESWEARGITRYSDCPATVKLLRRCSQLGMSAAYLRARLRQVRMLDDVRVSPTSLQGPRDEGTWELDPAFNQPPHPLDIAALSRKAAAATQHMRLLDNSKFRRHSKGELSLRTPQPSNVPAWTTWSTDVQQPPLPQTTSSLELRSDSVPFGPGSPYIAD